MKSTFLNQLTRSAIFVALLSIGGMISLTIPFTRIPFSLQVFFVLLVPSVLGPVYGTASVFIYILLGVIGMPVFAGMRSGPGILFGPTGGFLIGFLVLVPIVALLSKKIHLLLSLFIGLLILYFCGSIHFAFVTKVSYFKGLLVSVLPFVLFDIIKVIFAFEIINKLKSLKQI